MWCRAAAAAGEACCAAPRACGLPSACSTFIPPHAQPPKLRTRMHTYAGGPGRDGARARGAAAAVRRRRLAHRLLPQRPAAGQHPGAAGACVRGAARATCRCAITSTACHRVHAAALLHAAPHARTQAHARTRTCTPALALTPARVPHSGKWRVPRAALSQLSQLPQAPHVDVSQPCQVDLQGPLQLIDFEYSGPGYRGFDWGNHFNEYAGGCWA